MGESMDSTPWRWTEADRDAVVADLGREPRGVLGVGASAPSGRPLVVVTAPRLPDGTPFPTLFYLTDADLVAACSRLEAEHFMEDLSTLLAGDAALKDAYRRAHEDYLARRALAGRDSGVGDVPEIVGFSAGGMPERVKCLHALVGHSLAAGIGVNPVGDLAIREIVRRGWGQHALLGSAWWPKEDQVEDGRGEGGE